MIDDASPDRCGEICDVYAAKDARFRVFHNKMNQGLSVSRNIGIEKAVSDYLMFVDGDDYVHEDFCRLPYECAVKYHADLVTFRCLHIKRHEIFEKGKHGNDYDECSTHGGYLTKLEVMDLLLKGVKTGVGQAAWNKLYRKELFADISYPPGFLCEDIGTTYKIVHRAFNIYYLDRVLYYYCYRKGSITSQKTELRLRNLFELSMKQYYDLTAWGYPTAKLDMIKQNIALTYCIIKNPDTTDKDYAFCENVLCGSKGILFLVDVLLVNQGLS